MLHVNKNPARPAWLDIDLSALTGNILAIRRWLDDQAGIMAVVKANAYGHGLLPCARAAIQGGVSGLCVAITQEAIVLRESGVTAPILVMGVSDPDAGEAMVRHDIESTVSSIAQVEALARAAIAQKKTASVHLKIDTGMGRVGIAPEELTHFLEGFAAFEGDVRLAGLMTHLATADEPDLSLARWQVQRFRAAWNAIRTRPATPPVLHAANSPAICCLRESWSAEAWPDTRVLVRPGLLTYGIPPLCDGPCPNIRPALSWKARVVQARDVPPGTAVSYGASFRTSRPSRLALIPLGYADGFSRSLSNQGFVLLRGTMVPVIGRVCMDQFVVDATECGAEVGDEVVLIGSQGDHRIDVVDVSGWAGTIHHETLVRLSDRLPRNYVGESATPCTASL